MPGNKTMKMMKKVMMKGQRVAPVEGKHGASVALGTGADCPRTSLYIVPGNPARDTRKNPREKEYGPTSQFCPMKPDKPAQPGPLLRTMKPSSHTSCFRAVGTHESLTGSLIVPMATLTPRAHRSMARELRSLAGLSFLPSSHIETTRALGLMTPPPYPLPREGESCRLGSIVSTPLPAHPESHQGHLFMPRFRVTVPHRGHHGGHN